MSAHSTESIRAAWPGRPAYILDKIVAIELELDTILPGWRAKAPFHKTAYLIKARVKWLLKRHLLLTHTDGGQPAPLDWDVLVVRDPKNPNQCYAHPVLPPVVENSMVSRDPESPVTQEQIFFTGVHDVRLEEDSVPYIAKEMSLSQASVQRALEAKPVGWMDTDQAWVARYRSPPLPLNHPDAVNDDWTEDDSQ